MDQDIYIIDDKKELVGVLKKLFSKEKNYKFISVSSDEIDEALVNIPSLMIIDEDNIKQNVVDLCKTLRSDENNNITPIIVITSDTEREHRVEVLQQNVEYFIKKPIDEEYIYYTIKNIITLLFKNRKVSPLTGLPGNVQIQAEMKKRLLKKKPFAMIYLDLDNFKAYNDVYGFSNGDEIIKFTARVIYKHVHTTDSGDNFVGHIGGDDFVAVVNKTNYDELCQNIICEFDTQVEQYYNEEDLSRGYVEVANRRGVIEQFPIVSISIAVVEVENYKVSPLEIGEVAAQVKHSAKSVMGSTYVLNRRKF
jgi:diguanylate cyclase (GGDEF)-like protein